MPKTIRAKCVIVGESTVGKSALAQAFHSDAQSFPKNYTMTTGVELLVKPVTIPDCNDVVELFLYDCAGKEVFSDLIIKHLDHPNVIMVVYDVTNDTSFAGCSRWLERIRQIKPDISIPAVLVANKVDLVARRVVATKMGEQFAMENGLAYMECSAKESQNIDGPFQYLAKEFHSLYQERVEQFKDLV